MSESIRKDDGPDDDRMSGNYRTGPCVGNPRVPFRPDVHIHGVGVVP